MMDQSGSVRYLYAQVGEVVEVHPPGRAIVRLSLEGKEERVLVKVQKVVEDGKFVSETTNIVECLAVTDTIKFDCHPLDVESKFKCGWFAMRAWKFNYVKGTETTCAVHVSGVCNVRGVISELSPRRGVLTYECSGVVEKVQFLASRVYISGKRISAKQSLQTVLDLDDTVFFDAVPGEELETTSNCGWFASVVWKGQKPVKDLPYEDDSVIQAINKPLGSSWKWAEIRQFLNNPKLVFLKGQGKIKQIINEEYGIALMPLRINKFQHVTFHRSVCFLFKLNLAQYNLLEAFKEGDEVNIIACVAPDGFPSKLVASNVSVYIPERHREKIRQLEEQLH